MRRQYDKAIEESHKALLHDPYNITINMQLGKNLIYAGQFQLAIEHLQKTLSFDSTSTLVHYNLGMAYVGLNSFDKALHQFQLATDLGHGNTRMIAGLGFAKAVTGNKEEAQLIFDDLLTQSKSDYVPYYDLATVAVGLGNNEASIKFLEQAYTNREPWMPFIGMNPLFNSLRENPQFHALVEKIITNKK